MDDNAMPSAASADGRRLMESLGIRRALVDMFFYRDFRYNKLEEAVAQARRDRGFPS